MVLSIFAACFLLKIQWENRPTESEWAVWLNLVLDQAIEVWNQSECLFFHVSVMIPVNVTEYDHMCWVPDQCTVCKDTHSWVTVVWQSADKSGWIPERHSGQQAFFWLSLPPSTLSTRFLTLCQDHRDSVRTGKPQAGALKPDWQSWRHFYDWGTS